MLDVKSGEKKSIALLGECYVYLNNLLNMQSTTINVNNFFQKTLNLEKVIWHDGRDIGTLKAEIWIKYEPYIQQLFAGVMTERGLKKAAPLILPGSNKKMDQNKNLIELNEFLAKLNALNSDTKVSIFKNDDKELNYTSFQLKETIDRITRILSRSEKQSSISFTYSSVEQMLKAQESFLDIGETLWPRFDYMQGELETSYCQCFEAMFKRGEFDLQNIGFESAEKSIVDAKVKVGQRFQYFLYDVLSYVFDQLENRAISNSKRNFIEFYLAYSYFRISDFRSELLQVLSDDEIGPQTITQNQVIKTVLFSWREEFFDHLEKLSSQFQSNHAILTDALKKNWRAKFKSRGIIFFYFVKEWCSYVKKSIVVNNIDWDNIPGYNIIVLNFMTQITNREVSKYPDIMLESSILMLENPKLLKLFFYPILEKTK